MKQISVKTVEFIAFRLAKELPFEEPIPHFSTRFPNILESCLATPFQTFSRRPLYSGLVSKASILFYLILKNHPFRNGNKRIAMTTLLVFLYMNNKWIKADIQALFNFTAWIASSPAEFKNESVKAIERFLRIHIIKLR